MRLLGFWAALVLLGEALRQTVFPDQVDFATITTIVGGTVGGYITYSGAHRLLDKGTVGLEMLATVPDLETLVVPIGGGQCDRRQRCTRRADRRRWLPHPRQDPHDQAL